MPRLITGSTPTRIRANSTGSRGDRRRRARPGEVEILAAVKYVALEEMGVLARGRAHAARREPRPGARGQGDARPEFRWHFIGQLQSRKVKQILPHVRADPLRRLESALAQLERHGTPDTEILLEVNVAGEEGKAGIAPDELARTSSAARSASTA